MTNYKKLEKEVKVNSILLDYMMPALLKNKENKNKYVIFNQDVNHFADTLEQGFKLGLKEFGVNTGFVIRHVTTQKIILSSLVKL